MAISNQLLTIIGKYLRREESSSERKELYEWFDGLASTSRSLKKDRLNKLLEINKKRLFAEIGLDFPKKTIISPMWYRIAAAVTIFFLILSTITFINTRNPLIAINSVDLEKLAPQTGKATMTLSTGEVIILDTLNNSTTAQLGNGTLRNNGAGTLIYKAGNGAASENTISTLQTARGAQYNIALSDGTRVWLNAKSKLSFPEKFGAGDRIVDLSGEAYFEVNKTRQKSRFIVKSNGQAIEVLGTKFNVDGYDNAKLITTLAEGAVRVIPTNQFIKGITLKPNQQAVLSTSNIQQINVDASRIVAWKDGYFSFDGNNTQEILQEIADWYDISVQYNNPAKASRYTGKIPKNISLSRLIMLLGYQDIPVKAFKDKNNQLKLIVN